MSVARALSSHMAAAVGRGPGRQAAYVFGLALIARLVFGMLTSGTYDYDEFVLLLLARDFAHGSMPYSHFMFFHPPGALVLLRAVSPVTVLWWPSARLLTEMVDAGTATLVWFIGSRRYGQREGLLAGCLYGLSPLALIAAVRVGQEPLITFLGVAAIAALISGTGRKWTVLAGACLAIAFWIKYPAIYFLPVCVLLAPKRAILLLVSGGATLALLLLPFHDVLGVLFQQSVTFQRSRWIMDPTQRVVTILIYWVAVNSFAASGLRYQRQAWLVAGLFLAGLFVFASQVYYHYFLPAVPFAALLGGAGLARLPGFYARGLLIALAPLALGWGLLISSHDPSVLYVTAARLSQLQPTVQLLQRSTRAGEPILADRYEYAYLARRPALAHYFWNVGVLVDARYLEQRVHRGRAVVLSHGASSGYPVGFVGYLNRRYRRVTLPYTSIWLVPRRGMRLR